MLSCLEHVKSRRRQPSWCLNEANAAQRRGEEDETVLWRNSRKSKKGLYEVEILDKKCERGEVKIYYKGFGQCYDEWIRKRQLQYVQAANTSCADAGEDQFFTMLACELKHKLVPDRHEDPMI